MYELKTMAVPPSIQALSLAVSGSEKRLVAYIGAGVSKAEPTDLPLGNEVAARTSARVQAALGGGTLEGVDENNLLEVADKVEAEAGGRDLLQNMLPQTAPFTTAEANAGHQVLASLALEGVVVTLSANWDTCVERGAGTDLLRVVVTDEDRSRVSGAQLLKVHGCATKLGTLLVSSAQLDQPPVWVDHEVGARLADSTVVFVGLGDVPAYVKVRLDQLLRDVGHPERIRIVAPTISESWDELLPELRDEQKISASADEFLDDLIRAYVFLALTRLSEKVDNHIEAGDFAALGINLDDGKRSVLDKLEACSGLTILLGVRSTTRHWPLNVPVLMSPEVGNALLSLGVLASKRSLIGTDGRLWDFDDRKVALIIARETPGYEISKEASLRLEQMKTDGLVTESLVFLVHGYEGPLPQESFDIVEQAEESDVIDGTRAGIPALWPISHVLEGRLPDQWE